MRQCHQLDIEFGRPENYAMASETQIADLRLLSLLHALGDRDELVREAKRLLMASAMNESCWREICSMGREVAPGNPLFDPKQSIRLLRKEHGETSRDECRSITSDRRNKDRRAATRRTLSDRRSDDRRTTVLHWLGRERRDRERRQSLWR